jgi:hypothetical protein
VTGSTSENDCNLLQQGYGVNNESQVILCGGDQPTYGPPGREAGSPCEICPKANPGYQFNYPLGSPQLNPFVPETVAIWRSSALDDCLTQFGQPGDTSWQMGGAVQMAPANASTFEDCVAACAADDTCQYMTFDYASNICSLKQVTPE